MPFTRQRTSRSTVHMEIPKINTQSFSRDDRGLPIIPHVDPQTHTFLSQRAILNLLHLHLQYRIQVWRLRCSLKVLVHVWFISSPHVTTITTTRA